MSISYPRLYSRFPSTLNGTEYITSIDSDTSANNNLSSPDIQGIQNKMFTIWSISRKDEIFICRSIEVYMWLLDTFYFIDQTYVWWSLKIFDDC